MLSGRGAAGEDRSVLSQSCARLVARPPPWRPRIRPGCRGSVPVGSPSDAIRRAGLTENESRLTRAHVLRLAATRPEGVARPKAHTLRVKRDASSKRRHATRPVSRRVWAVTLLDWRGRARLQHCCARMFFSSSAQRAHTGARSARGKVLFCWHAQEWFRHAATGSTNAAHAPRLG